MGQFSGITVKRVAPCRCLDGHFKESYEMSMAWEPNRRSNFFFSLPAHLCAVIYNLDIVDCDVKADLSSYKHHIKFIYIIYKNIKNIWRRFISRRISFKQQIHSSNSTEYVQCICCNLLYKLCTCMHKFRTDQNHCYMHRNKWPQDIQI